MTFFTVPDARSFDEDRCNEELKNLGTDVASGCGSRVNSDNHTTLESESECGSTMLNFDSAAGIGMIICVEA